MGKEGNRNERVFGADDHHPAHDWHCGHHYVQSKKAGQALRALTAILLSPFAAVSRSVRRRVEDLRLVRKLMSYPLGRQMLTNVEFRSEVFLYTSFLIDLLYCVMQAALGIFYRSIWAGALAVFHLLLAAMRLQLMNHRGWQWKHLNAVGQWRKYRICGMILLCMTPLFASILILVVHKNGGSRYAGPVIYLMAVYTFVTAALSISNAVKFRRHPSPVLSAAMLVKLIAALVSLLSLEAAILARYDSRGPAFRQAVTGTAGGAVCLTVFGIAAYMVIQGTKHMKSESQNGK